MTGIETRSVSRDSLFLLAEVRVEQNPETHKVRVRNLSDGGMMGEGSLNVMRGHRLAIQLRNIAMISGTVAWVQDNRFGIAFDEEIDSQLARRPLQTDEESGPGLPDRAWVHRAPAQVVPSRLRKI